MYFTVTKLIPLNYVLNRNVIFIHIGLLVVEVEVEVKVEAEAKVEVEVEKSGEKSEGSHLILKFAFGSFRTPRHSSEQFSNEAMKPFNTLTFSTLTMKQFINETI